MKSFVKQYMIYILVATCCLSGFAVLFYFSLQLSSNTDVLVKETESYKSDINDLKQQISFFGHIENDFEKAEKDLAFLSTAEKELSLFLKYIFNETENVFDKWSSKSAESVNASLTRLLPRLRKKCGDNYILLPQLDSGDSANVLFQNNNSKNEESTFGFSFTSYDGFWPSFSTEEARRLGIQTEIVKELIDHLSLSTDSNHSVEILSLQRETVGEIDKSNIGSDAFDVSKLKNGLMRDLIEVNSFVFRLSIQTQTIPLRKILNKLRPPFLIRELNIQPVELTQSDDFDSSLSSPDPFSLEPVASQKFLPIVSKVDSKVELIFEYVISSSRNLDSLYQSLSTQTEAYPELLYGWLNKSGHESSVDSARKFFNEKNIR